MTEAVFMINKSSRMNDNLLQCLSCFEAI